MGADPFELVTHTWQSVATVPSGDVQDIVIAPAGFGAYGGSLITSGYSGVFAIDPTTGIVTTLSPGTLVSSIGFTPAGSLLGTDYNANNILSFAADGSTSVFYSGVGNQPDGLSVHPLTGDVYVATWPGIFSKINPAGTTSTLFADGWNIDGGYWPTPMNFSNDGERLLFGTTSGDGTQYENRAIGGFESISGPGSAVPEPGSMTLLCTGALGVICKLRRRRQRVAPEHA
jgi:hypothetical protein